MKKTVFDHLDYGSFIVTEFFKLENSGMEKGIYIFNSCFASSSQTQFRNLKNFIPGFFPVCALQL